MLTARKRQQEEHADADRGYIKDRGINEAQE